MSFQNILKLFIRRLNPINSVAIFATTPMFINPDPPKNPKDDQKLIYEASKLSYDNLLKQSTINAVNSASQALTVTYAVIETTSKEYRKLLTKLIILMNQANLQEVADSHWDEILEVRSQMQEKKKIIMKFIGYVDYVHKMSEAASEISFLAGMDNLSTSLTQRIDDALSKIQTEKTNNLELEKEYIKVQEESIQNAKTKKENVVQETIS